MKRFPERIVSDRLCLKPLSDIDLLAFQLITNHPKITEIISFLPTPFEMQDAENLIREGQKDDQRFYGIWLQDLLIGFFAICLYSETELEIGYWVGVNYQGKGYASEALLASIACLKVEMPDYKIIAECLLSNIGSWRVLEKNGFKFLGAEGKKPGRKKLEYI